MKTVRQPILPKSKLPKKKKKKREREREGAIKRNMRIGWRGYEI